MARSAREATPRVGAWARACLTLVAVVAIDQAAKQAVVHSLDRGESVDVFFGLDLTNTRNTGVAFGAFEGRGRSWECPSRWCWCC